MSPIPHPSPRKLLGQTLALGACWVGMMSSLSAQTIPNPSFESDVYAAYPGYASGNGGVITGWTIGDATRVGLNPSGGSPFADNGTVPAGTNVAFLQNSATATLGTTITGLTSGTAYRINFRANARGGQAPALKVTVDGNPVNVTVDFNPTASNNVAPTSVNSTNPYHFVSCTFTAAGATAALSLLNDAGGDNTAVVDDFSIELASAPVAAGIVATRWTGDADSGIDSQFRYTHAHTFGNARVQATVNGIHFSPVAGGNPDVLNHMTWTGLSNAFGAQTRTMTGGSNNLGQSFIFGAGAEPRNVIIKGLKPNTTYVATIYGVGWENGQRSADFSGSAGGITSNVNLDAYGITNGITVRYRYTTDGSGTPVTLNYNLAAGSGTFHTAGFSNREDTPGVSVNPWTLTAWNNDATSGVNEGASYNYTHAYNFNSGTNAIINGVTFIGKPGANPSEAGKLAMSGFGSGFGNDANNVTDATGSRAMANDFIFNGFPGAITLSGLTPGKEYRLTLFSVGFDDNPATRAVEYVGYSQTNTVLSQNAFGNNNGARIDYVYTAPSTGSVTVTTNPIDVAAGSLHLYGLANRETTPQTVLAFVSHPQSVFVTQAGSSVTFTASASGQLPLSYVWKKDGNPIPGQSGTTNLNTSLTLTGVTAADVADYTVSITGSGQGTITSNPGHLTFIPDRVPGLFDTGMGEHCTVLADGLADPHYLILTNPDGDSLIPAVVEDSNAFPIVTGPWLQNTALSKWVGPRFNTAGAAGEGVDNGAGPGVYVYQTTFDLTGFDLSSVRITGGWATDNLGVKVLVNGHDVGLTNTAQFPSLTPFLITGAANFVAGSNTLEFWVQNQGAGVGYTGLRVDGLQGFGNVLANTPPHIAVNPVGAVVQPNDTICLSVSASGSGPLAYQWYLGNTLLTGETAATIMVNVDSIAKLGDYKVVVSNGTSPNATSSIATLTYNPTFSGYSFNAIKDTPTSVGIAKILAAATDADNGTLALSAVSATSSQGGAVAIAGSKVTYNPPAGYTGGDSFSVTILDGQGGSVTGTVIITVGAGSGPSLNQAVLTVLPGGNVSVVFMGIPGQSYQIQRSADLLSWTTMQTSTAAADGQLPYLDTSPLSGSGFYRTKIP